MRAALFPALILLALAPLAQAQTAAPAAATPAAETNKPLAVVNGKEIPALYGELVKREMAQGQPDSPQLDERVRESLINLELLSRAALDKGLDKDPNLAAALDIRRKDQLAKAYLEDYVKAHPVSDAEIQTMYDKAKAEPLEPEYRARHILVKTEAEAKKIIADLGKKAKFEDLAKKHSKDPGSAKNGGALDWSTAAPTCRSSPSARRLKKGETTKTPVKTQFGYHVIRLDDTRQPELPPLDAVRGEIVKQLQNQRIATPSRQRAPVQKSSNRLIIIKWGFVPRFHLTGSQTWPKNIINCKMFSSTPCAKSAYRCRYFLSTASS
jgi:peptidyl-prolyl cis-trans isomerase C